MDKARIVNGEDFGGIYNTQYFIDNPELTSDWVLTEVLPEVDLLVKKWNGTTWIEGATSEEIVESKRDLIESIDNEYTTKISNLMRKSIEQFISDGTPIPQNILDERNLLRNECNAKIAELGVNVQKYRETNKKEIILLN